MTTIAELELQRKAINEAIAQAKADALAAKEANKAARDDAITQVKSLIAEHGILGKEIFEKAKRAPLPVKYKDATGANTWTGQGKQPKWLTEAVAAGYTLDQFLVQAEIATA